MMRAVQSVARYFPDPAKVGGIQVNMRQVGVALRPLGVESTILASIEGQRAFETTDHGMRVLRYPVGDDVPVEPNHGPIRHQGFEYFARWIEELRPDVYHQHQWTPKCGYHHLRFAKSLGLPAVVSIHVPLPFCVRKTLMINGAKPCSGRIDPDACVPCVEHAPAEPLQSFEPADQWSAVTDPAERRHIVRCYVEARRVGLRLLAGLADLVLVAADWLHEALVLNGMDEAKIRVCRYGISDPGSAVPSSPAGAEDKRVIRIGFFGRWTQMKGPDVVLSALRLVGRPESFEFHMYGIAQEPGYERFIAGLAAGMPGVFLHAPVPMAALPGHMAAMDVIAMPSRWLEAGPLTVLHAFAAGRPVLGSSLGGIAEQVTHGVDGLLLPAGDPVAWARALDDLQAAPRGLAALASGVRRPRAVETQAAQTAELYRQLACAGRRS